MKLVVQLVVVCAQPLFLRVCFIDANWSADQHQPSVKRGYRTVAHRSSRRSVYGVRRLVMDDCSAVMNMIWYIMGISSNSSVSPSTGGITILAETV